MVKRRALVTGDAGFVGNHFARRLIADGWSLHCWDIARTPMEDCRRLFATDHGGFDLVIHCAAVVGGRATIEGQPMAVATDLAIDSDLWQWALRTRPGRVVYFSSSAAYPTWLQNRGRPGRLTESTIDLSGRDDEAHHGIRQPDQTYGLAKLVGEIQAAHVRAEGVPVTVVRPFSGYGEDQALDYPHPSFIDRAARRADPFDVWGDGQQTRDWIHIDDITDAVMACVEGGVDGPLNLCTGRATTFDELAAIVCGQAGYSPELRHHPDAPSGVRYRVGDPTLMSAVWTPRVSLEEGVARALAAWQKAAA